MEESVKVDKLNRTINAKRSSTQFLSLQLSSTASASITLADGQSGTFINTLSSASNSRLFGFPNISLYVGSISATTIISDGTGINPDSFKWAIWVDWGASDNNNIIAKAYIQNNSGGTETILFRSNWRFLVEGATIS